MVKQILNASIILFATGPLWVNLNAQKTIVFSYNNVKLTMNKNQIGGRLDYVDGKTTKNLYCFEKSIEYYISPRMTKIVVVDKCGTSSFSLFVVKNDFSVSGLNPKLYRMRPDLNGYSSVYPTYKKWVSDDIVKLNVVGYGPFDANAPGKIEFQILLSIDDK